MVATIVTEGREEPGNVMILCYIHKSMKISDQYSDSHDFSTCISF